MIEVLLLVEPGIFFQVRLSLSEKIYQSEFMSTRNYVFSFIIDCRIVRSFGLTAEFSF